MILKNLLNKTLLREKLWKVLKQIQNKVNIETKSFRFYKFGIAASAILILGVGALYFYIDKKESNTIVYEINKEELPSTKFEKQTDTVATEVVFQEREI